MIRSANGAAHRFLGAQPVQHVSHGALALSHGVDAVDDLCSRQIQRKPEHQLLKNRDLDESIDSQHSTGCRGLGFEWRRRAGDLNRFGDRAHFESDIDARRFIGSQYDAVAQVAFEAGRLYG